MKVNLDDYISMLIGLFFSMECISWLDPKDRSTKFLNIEAFDSLRFLKAFFRDSKTKVLDLKKEMQTLNGLDLSLRILKHGWWNVLRRKIQVS